MKSDAVFKKYLTAEHAERREYLKFSFSAFSANSAVNDSFLFRFDRPSFWPAAALNPEPRTLNLWP
jgi:hypothetical protein